jgi:hypothetical protein
LINSGFLIRKWGNIIEGQRALSTTFMMANSIMVRKKIQDSEFCRNEISKTFGNYWKNYETNPLEGRDNILSSICPQVKIIRFQTFKKIYIYIYIYMFDIFLVVWHV